MDRIINLYAISDLHLNPGDEFPMLNLADDDTLVINGDLLNILPLGFKAWDTQLGFYTLSSIAAHTPSDSIVIAGNHEGRLAWVHQLFYTFRKFTIARSYEVGPYYFEHGHKRMPDWWFLRHIADDITEWATSNPLFRSCWFEFCKRRGWMPGSYPPNPKAEEIIGFYWANCFRHSIKSGKIWVVGHSHIKAELLPPGVKGGVIDLGKAEVRKLDVDTLCDV